MQRRPQTIAFWHNHLPHWEVEGGRYFMTIHLRGAIPQAGRARIRSRVAELAQVKLRQNQQWLVRQRAIFREMELWLDRAEWSAKLAIEDVAQMVQEAIVHRNQSGEWLCHAFAIMPTHLHLFVEFGSGQLKATTENFKRWTGKQAALILDDDSSTGLWQADWFDHWSRSDAEDDRIVHYIRNNPVKAGLVKRAEDWPYNFPK
jgi:REP element-mobilizing transposase RayT